MIYTTGKKNPEREARTLQEQKVKAALGKRPKKELKSLSAKEKADALDAMLEWWMALKE
jgi:hypothetical protein